MDARVESKLNQIPSRQLESNLNARPKESLVAHELTSILNQGILE